MRPRQSSHISSPTQAANAHNFTVLIPESSPSISRHQAKNRYYRHSRISEQLLLEVLHCFSTDMTATQAAADTGISVRSVNSIYLKLRRWIAQTDSADINTAKQDIYILQIENDDIVLRVISDSEFDIAKHLTTTPTLAGDTQSWEQLNGALALMAPSRSRLKRRLDIATVDHTLLDDFWDYTRLRLPRFNGIHKHTMSLHLQETAFRFNCRHTDMYKLLVSKLEQQPI